MEKKIQVPDSWDDVTIGQFQEINSLTSEDHERTIDVISILIDEDPELIRKFDVSTFTTLINMLTWTNEMPSDANYKPIITIGDEQFGLVPKLQNLTVGEWMDLDTLLKDPMTNMHQVMSVLYRPLVTAFNDRDRLIDEYDFDKMERQAIKFQEHVKISDVYGALVFFYLIGNEYTRITAEYLDQTMQEVTKI